MLTNGDPEETTSCRRRRVSTEDSRSPSLGSTIDGLDSDHEDTLSVLVRMKHRL